MRSWKTSSPPVCPKAELRAAPAKQSPIGAPPPPVPDLELDPDARGVGVHYPPRGWRIPRNLQGEADVNEVRPDIDDMVDDLASGWSEIEARRIGGETAFAPLATQPCAGTLGISSRASSHRASFSQRRGRGTTTTEDQPPTRLSTLMRLLFTGAVPPPKPRAQEARGIYK